MTAEFPKTLNENRAIHSELVVYIAQRLAGAVASDTPFFIHTLGFPGSGKTAVVHKIAEKFAEKFASAELIIFDDIMQSMPSYINEGDKVAAFETCELPARIAGYHLIEDLIAKGSNIIFEHSGSRADHVELLGFAKSKGYLIIIVDIQVDKDIAKSRLQERERRDGRYVPPHYVDAREKVIVELRPQYKQIADTWIDVENSGNLEDINKQISVL